MHMSLIVVAVKTAYSGGNKRGDLVYATAIQIHIKTGCHL
jgi:hypothetical protein